MKISKKFSKKRSINYARAMREQKDVRLSELKNFMLKKEIKKKKMAIVDFGAGSGYLTNYLSKLYPDAIVYAMDLSKEMLSQINSKSNIRPIPQNGSKMPFDDNSIDLVISLATFHHIEKKKEVFKEIERVLSDGGLFIIADVLDKTNVQRFFDSVVCKYCIDGHSFPFLTKREIERLVVSSDLEHVSSKLKDTPWQFRSRSDMLNFLKTLFSLKLSDEKLLKFLNKIFKISGKKRISLNWQLGYHVIKKRGLTERIQLNHRMQLIEKKQFIKIIKKLPWLYVPILSAVKKNIRGVNSIVDVGCGDGYLLGLISKKFPNINLSGVDIDRFFINKASKQYGFDFLNENGVATSRKGDMILCNLALHHFVDPVKLIKNLYRNAYRVLVISDQLRPFTKEDLILRLEKRKDFIDNKDVPFYRKNEESSILEAYNKNEVLEILKQTKIPFKIKFFDNDYYERFVVVFKKKMRKRK
jgi:ubiquinone/menaquinone biosynthesis C-methylase UbiE